MGARVVGMELGRGGAPSHLKAGLRPLLSWSNGAKVQSANLDGLKCRRE